MKLPGSKLRTSQTPMQAALTHETSASLRFSGFGLWFVYPSFKSFEGGIFQHSGFESNGIKVE